MMIINSLLLNTMTINHCNQNQKISRNLCCSWMTLTFCINVNCCKSLGKQALLVCVIVSMLMLFSRCEIREKVSAANTIINLFARSCYPSRPPHTLHGSSINNIYIYIYLYLYSTTNTILHTFSYIIQYVQINGTML